MTQADLHGALLLALLDRAESGTEAEDGGLDDATIDDLEALADLADDPEQLAALAGEEDEPAGPEPEEGDALESRGSPGFFPRRRAARAATSRARRTSSPR